MIAAEEKMLSVREVAERLNVTTHTVFRYRKLGMLGGCQYTPGAGHWFYRESEVEEFLARSYRKQAPDG